MAQAKVLSEQEFKRALAVVAKRRHHTRDRLALLLTHWAGMRVCEVATLTIDKVQAVTVSIDHQPVMSDLVAATVAYH
jgi:integrase